MIIRTLHFTFFITVIALIINSPCFDIYARETAEYRQEMQMLAMINASRGEKGLKPLKFSVPVSKAAYKHSKDMLENNFLSHTSSDGRGPGERILAIDGLFILSYGENVAQNISFMSAHHSLMLSKGHRENILSPEFTHIGISILKSPADHFYITQKFVRLPEMTEFSDIKDHLTNIAPWLQDKQYEAVLENIAKRQLSKYIDMERAPAIDRMGGFNSVRQIALRASSMEEALQNLNGSLSGYKHYGFYAQFAESRDGLSSLYCIFIFAKD